MGCNERAQNPGCYRQAILVLRWLLDGTRIIQLAVDNQVSRSTGYAYLHEGLTVLAGHAPGLSSVLLAVKMAGYAREHADDSAAFGAGAICDRPMRRSRRNTRPAISQPRCCHSAADC